MKIAVLIALVMLFAVGANAQAIVSENFDYTNGSLLTANGWTAHSGAGTQAITVTTGGGLSYSGYENSGIGNAAMLDNTGEDVSKTFTSVNTGTLYFSALVNVTTAQAGYFLHLGGSASAFAARVYVQPSVNSGKINFYLSNRSNDAAPTGVTDFDLNTTYLLIVKYDVSSTGTGSLWVVSSGVPADESAAGVPEDTTANTGQALIDRICLRQYNASQNITVDGIRVADSWTFAPLPVELTSFTAVAKGRGVELAWKTATELNNKGFEIERSSSSNGWQNIGFVAGNGTTNAPKSYTFVDNSASGAVSYRLKQVDNDGSFEYSSAVKVTVAAPASYTLSQNHPNPFNPATTISYSLPAAGFVTLKVYDMLGKEVATLVNGMQQSGLNKASFDASQLPSGIYFARLSSGSFNSVIKMTLMK